MIFTDLKLCFLIIYITCQKLFLQEFVLHETQKLLYGAKQKNKQKQTFFPFLFCVGFLGFV